MFHLRALLRVLRVRNSFDGIQLRPAELLKITHAVSEFESCNMLVFGLGYDSPFWSRVNGRGRTVFLEDSEPWYERICSIHPELEAHKVTYPGNITQWEDLLDKPERLAMDLPEEVSGTDWDVILVDGPQGNTISPEIPGRMSSIYEASRLIGKNGWVFVHDAERVVETSYSRHYLGSENFVERVRGRALLLIYRF